jgi:peptidoglycan/LPS O-acetylase OafA/YrhL
MDGIALGCLAAIVANRISFGDKTNLVLRGLMSLGAILCIFIVVFRETASSLGFYKAGVDVTVLEIGTALMVIALQQRFEKNAAPGHWPTAPLRWFGRNSYEVYLTHMFVVWPMVGAFFRFHQTINAAPLWFLVITGLTGVAGYTIARFYSEPLNRTLRAKLLPARRSAAL